MSPWDKNSTLQVGAGENVFLKQDFISAAQDVR